MKKVLRFIFNRVVITALLMAAQMLLIVIVLLMFNDYFVYFYAINVGLSIGVAIKILNEWTNPAYKLAWILPIMIVPFFGVLLYVLFGGRSIRHESRNRMRVLAPKVNLALCKTGLFEENPFRNENPSAEKQSKYILNTCATPPYANTHTEYLPLGEIFHKRLMEELPKAKKYIFLEYFIIQPGVMWDSILEILVQKAAAGVDVRVVYDDMGCIFTLPFQYNKKLEAMGIQCGVFNPFMPVLSSRFNHRSHRKNAIIDGIVAFTGGINLSDEYMNVYEKFGHWKDTAIMLKGEGAWGLTTQFLSMWDDIRGEARDYCRYLPTYTTLPQAEGFVQPYSDNPFDNDLVGETVYMNMITQASKYLYITTPYLILDNEMLIALCNAAMCGVDVRIITPHIRDKWYIHPVTRSYYTPLIEKGVKIYEYTPGFIHAKSFVSDDLYSVVGTVNLDYRSLYLHFENGVWMYKAAAVAQVRDDFLATLKVCQSITLEECLKTPWYKKIFRSILRVFAPLM